MAAFRHRTTVRFFEIDRAGIAFYGRVFEYCHVAYEEMFAAGGIDLERLFAEGSWGTPVVHAEADFHHPMRLGDALDIDLTVERLGEGSVAFAYRITNQDGRRTATARLVHAFVDRTEFRPRPCPEPFRAALERLGLVDPV